MLRALGTMYKMKRRHKNKSVSIKSSKCYYSWSPDQQATLIYFIQCLLQSITTSVRSPHSTLKMTVSFRTCALLLLVPMAMCAVPPYDRYTVNNKNLDHIDVNDLTPPQDPATNDFPKEPVIPLLPTCADAGYFRDPYNCGKFYYCPHVGVTPATYYCRPGLIFNHLTNVCDDPAFVDC